MIALSIQSYIDKLGEARRLLTDALDRVGDHGDEVLYSDGAEWTIRQLAIHLMIADRGHNAMVTNIAEGRNIIPEDYDLERFNRRSVEKQADLSLEQVRAALDTSRQELLVWLQGIREEQLKQEGRHASMRIMSVGQMLDLMAWHEKTHARDIMAHLDQTEKS